MRGSSGLAQRLLRLERAAPHPGPRQLENIRLRERIREEFARSRQTYGSPRLAHALGCPGRRNRIARLMRLERIFARQNAPSIERPSLIAATADPSRLTDCTTSLFDA